MGQKRCFGKFLLDAKECSTCCNHIECVEHTNEQPVTVRQTPIRAKIISALSTVPMTIEQLKELVSDKDTDNLGTSIYYHLGLMKRDGQLSNIEIGGERFYCTFRLDQQLLLSSN